MVGERCKYFVRGLIRVMVRVDAFIFINISASKELESFYYYYYYTHVVKLSYSSVVSRTYFAQPS